MIRVPEHPSGINPKVVAKVFARRGRLHAFDTLVPARTALVTIDLSAASVHGDESCQPLVPRINQLSEALRNAGGHVAWVLTDFEPDARTEAQFGLQTSDRFRRESIGDDGKLWRAFTVGEKDVHARKSGMSAFFPGKCDLHQQLAQADIDTVLIAGTVTNVCCESSARDACELGLRVIMISDACAGHRQGLHEASLTTFYRSFGDVRPTSELLTLIKHGAAAQ